MFGRLRRLLRWETPKTRQLRGRIAELEEKLQIQVVRRKELRSALVEAEAVKRARLEHIDALEELVREANRRLENFHKTLDMLSQPARQPPCTKIQLRDREEAVAMAREVERNTGCGEMEPYRCKVCLRHPFTGAYYWHIRHIKKDERGFLYEPGTVKPTSIAHRIDPTVLAKLRNANN